MNIQTFKAVRGFLNQIRGPLPVRLLISSFGPVVRGLRGGVKAGAFWLSKTVEMRQPKGACLTV